MTTKLRGVILLVISLLFVGVTPTAALAAPAAPADTVSGAVSLGASNMSPVRAEAGDVLVIAVRFPGGVEIGRSLVSSNGEFSIAASGSVSLHFFYLGDGDYLSETWGSPSTGVPYFHFIAAGYDIGGHVDMDIAGRAAAAGQVSVRAIWYGSSRQTTTDADGNYDFGAVEPGPYQVVFEVPGDASYPQWQYDGTSAGGRVKDPWTFSLDRDRTDLDVVIGIGPSIAGTIRDSRGNPVPGIDVTASGSQPDGQAFVRFSTTTDQNGHYVVRSLDPSFRYVVNWGEAAPWAYGRWPGGNLFLCCEFIAPSGTLTGYDGVALRGGRIEGGTGTNGPGDGYHLLVRYRPSAAVSWTAPASSDYVGPGSAFTIDDLPPGEYMIGLATGVNQGQAAWLPAFSLAEGAVVTRNFFSAQWKAWGATEVYRFWSSTKRSHFFTSSADERDYVIANYPDEVWNYEGVAFNAVSAGARGGIAVYRFWSDTYGGHFYTTNESERDLVIARYDDRVWRYEGIAFYAYPSGSDLGERTVSRFWSPTFGHHFYSADAAETAQVKRIYPPSVWTHEGAAFEVPLSLAGE